MKDWPIMTLISPFETAHGSIGVGKDSPERLGAIDELLSLKCIGGTIMLRSSTYGSGS